MIPNLYATPLSPELKKQAEADPFGTVTLWTYFNNCLQYASQSVSDGSLNDSNIQEAAKEDLVYAAFLLYAKQSGIKSLDDKRWLLKLLNRCVISTYDIVEGAISIFQDETGVSVLENFSFIQLLLAVTIKHYNHDVLSELAVHKAGGQTIFTHAGPLIVSQLKSSGLSAVAWNKLAEGGWVKQINIPEDQSQHSGSSSDHPELLKAIADKHVPGAILDICVKDLPCAALRSYFPSVPRTLYTGIPPMPKWPGSPVMVKYAAARTDQDGLEILRFLVEVGGLPVNDSVTWWKAGDHDPREWESKCNDGSDCKETALHIAIDRGNAKVVEYLLTHGAVKVRDGYGRDQLERAVFREKPEIVKLFEKHRWDAKSTCIVA